MSVIGFNTSLIAPGRGYGPQTGMTERYANEEHACWIDQIGMVQGMVVMTKGAQNLSGEQDQNAAIQAMRSLMEN